MANYGQPIRLFDISLFRLQHRMEALLLRSNQPKVGLTIVLLVHSGILIQRTSSETLSLTIKLLALFNLIKLLYRPEGSKLLLCGRECARVSDPVLHCFERDD